MNLTENFWEAALALLNFKKKTASTTALSSEIESFLQGYSIEVMPRTAEKIPSFQDILPKGTRVYIAHLEGTPITDMVATARRVAREGYEVMPHLPARIIKDQATLKDWLNQYQNEANVDQALLLAGGVNRPHGEFDSSMQMLETGIFDQMKFKRLHVAGHPEGNKDIDPDGSTKNVQAAMHWKQKFSERTDADMALTTQFAFESGPIIRWADSVKAAGVEIPIHIGIAGPAKLKTLIKFAIACGVGPSLKVLQKRAMDITKLLLPYEPTQVLTELANHKAQNPDFNVTNVHFFPLGGIKTNTKWAIENAGRSGVPANQT